MAEKYTFDPVPNGDRVSNAAGHLVAIITTRCPVEKTHSADGDRLAEPKVEFVTLPREEWTIHWTNATQSVGMLEGFLAALPVD